ncbi:MAG TPA: hydantoinase/oxoprolinase family protein, partial [Solirubrobacterales bacterium]|nr:hydantoinase/oxoprolinase family protein [Solirubrobacterales bacterium]
DAADRAIASLAGELGIEALEAAEGIVRIANQEMVRALRVVTVERGVDPRGFALLPFGGAGPMHAAAIAEELGIRTILCPRAGGVLSALGLCASQRRRDTVRTVMLSEGEMSAERIAATVDSMIGELGSGLDDARPQLTYKLRYAGQAFELPVPGPAAPEPNELIEAFERAHDERYGHRDPEGEVVLVDVELALVAPGPAPRPVAAGEGVVERSSRRVFFDGEWIETPVLRGEPAAGSEAEGPVVFELPEATFVVAPGWSTSVDEHGTLVSRWTR